MTLAADLQVTHNKGVNPGIWGGGVELHPLIFCQRCKYVRNYWLVVVLYRGKDRQMCTQIIMGCKIFKQSFIEGFISWGAIAGCSAGSPASLLARSFTTSTHTRPVSATSRICIEIMGFSYIEECLLEVYIGSYELLVIQKTRQVDLYIEIMTWQIYIEEYSIDPYIGQYRVVDFL